MNEKRYTKEDIEELKKVREENPELLTPEERRLANLKPVKPGEVRNKTGGKKKGTKYWSTHFKRLMADENFLKTIIKQSPKEWEGIVEDCPADVIAAGIIATVTKEVAKAIAEGKSLDHATQRSIELLNKLGWGEKVVHEVDDENGFFQQPSIQFNVVEDRKPKDGE